MYTFSSLKNAQKRTSNQKQQITSIYYTDNYIKTYQKLSQRPELKKKTINIILSLTHRTIVTNKIRDILFGICYIIMYITYDTKKNKNNIHVHS